MKNKNSKLRLKLNKETISNLDNIHMNSVYGGDGDDGDHSRQARLCGMELTVGVQITCIGGCAKETEKTEEKKNI